MDRSIGDKPIKEELSFPIRLSDRIREAVNEAKIFQAECAELAKQVDSISQLLRSTLRFSDSASKAGSLYERPIRLIVAIVSNNLDIALTLVCKCNRYSNILCGGSIVTQADFRKLQTMLDVSTNDMKWLLGIFERRDIIINHSSTPSIASNNPMLSCVWSHIGSIHRGQLIDRIEAANELTMLAIDKQRNYKKMIAEEGGFPALLKLLKERSSPDAQITAVQALLHLVDDQERARLIAHELGVPIVVQVLGDSPRMVQIWVANLVATMAEHDRVVSTRRITETKGLLCLAKLVEKEQGVLQFFSLMAIMHIAAAAESDPALRQTAFKTTSPTAKYVVDQLVRVIKELRSLSMLIPAIRSIGSLARTFQAREATRVIAPLVEQLSHWNHGVATEAAISLGKFACSENFLCMEHTKAMIEFNAVPPLTRLLRGGNQIEFDGVLPEMRLLNEGEPTFVHVLILICYLAIHAGNSEALKNAGVLLTALKGADHLVTVQPPEVKKLVSKAINHLNLHDSQPE